jgi:hypothetical protein
MAASAINSLLNDKLFQVIGSTPRSIAESLSKIDLKNKSEEGIQMFAACVFAAAVNKPTLETFLADPRFASVRRIISAVLSIQNRSNMTAMTLLGHCFLTTDLADNVTFTFEFRKKMGQRHLWAGDLTSGSLSEKQRGILAEKKRVTDQGEAEALGNGFLKVTGLITGALTAKESEFFGVPAAVAEQRAVTPPEPVIKTGYTPPHARGASLTAGTTSSGATSSRFASLPMDIPEDVLNYRRNILGQSDASIAESLGRGSKDDFISRTRLAMQRNPDGLGSAAGSAIGK